LRPQPSTNYIHQITAVTQRYGPLVLVHESLPKLSRGDLQVYLEILRDSVIDWVGDERHEFEVVFLVADEAIVEELLGN
jgi:hypothetical protein